MTGQGLTLGDPWNVGYFLKILRWPSYFELNNRRLYIGRFSSVKILLLLLLIIIIDNNNIIIIVIIITVKLRWLEHWWLVYHDCFELILKSLGKIPWLHIRDKLMWFFFFIENGILCVLIRIASLRRFYWEHTTYRHIKENQRDPYYASWPGAIINPQWFELPLSRIKFHGPKGVRAIEVLLYLKLSFFPPRLDGSDKLKN